MLAYVLSFVDRVILGLLVGPIRADLGISDTQMSVLYDFGFAIFHITLGLPMGVGLALVIGGIVVEFVSRAPVYVLPLVGAVQAWQVAFFVVGLPGVLVALWMRTLSEPPRRAQRRSADAEHPSVADTLAWLRAHWRAYAALILGYSVTGMVMNAVQIRGVQYQVRVIGFTRREAGLSVGLVIGVFGTLGILTGGWVHDRLRRAGHVDASLRTGLIAALALVPFGATATLPGNAWLSLLFVVGLPHFRASLARR